MAGGISNNTKALPERTSSYLGRLTDTNRWDTFRNRADDIFICTPPKCGTTWTQAICAHLIFLATGFDGKITDISPWFDSKIEGLEVCLKVLESQTHRRFIKTHTPLDGIPYFEDCDYLIVYRDPRDVYFSIRNHLLNLLESPDIPQLASDPKEGFRAWVAAPFESGIGEQRSLAAFTQHYLSFWNYRHLGNFHFFHYADMKRNLNATVRRIAKILNIDLTDDAVSIICHAVSFAEMKNKASIFAPGSGKSLFKSDAAFFSSGNNEQWRNELDTDEIQRYTSRVNDLLSPRDVEWLENGNG